MPRKKKSRRPRWYRRGEVIYQKLVRQNDPITIGDLSQAEVGPALAAKVAAFMYEIGLLCPRLSALQDGEK